MDPLHHYREIWLVDFEYRQPPGERPFPICMVAREARSGRLLRLWMDELRHLPESPFSIQPDSLFIAYFASAEINCFLSLNWLIPQRIIDLYVEFRCRTSGLPTSSGRSLLDALTYFGLDSIEAAEKEAMRDLAMRGDPYSVDERQALLDYCQTDVDALARLLPAMIDKIDVPRALLRGRYIVAVARMETNGIPIDDVMLPLIRDKWTSISDKLIERIDRNYGVFDGRTFKSDRWAAWVGQRNIAWPALESGSLALDDDTFREMARTYPEVAPIRELRSSLSKLRLEDLAVGHDNRNRCMLSPFASSTGRNQPSNNKFVSDLPAGSVR